MSGDPLAPVLAELSKVITGWFATADARAKGKIASAVVLVLHRGARTKGAAPKAPDPKGLFDWIGPDRGVARFESRAEVVAVAAPLRAVIRRWIKEL